MLIFKIATRFVLFFGLSLAMTSYASVTESSVSTKLSIGSGGANAIEMRCWLDEKQYLRSMVTVLQTDPEDLKFRGVDIAVTTGHGLIDSDRKMIENCFVYGRSGRKYKVKSRKLALGYKDAAPSDWAVIVFDEIRDKNLVRYAVNPTLTFEIFEKLAQENVAVNFSTARGIRENGQECHLFPRDYASLKAERFEGIVPHSCRSIGGQSGSPVSMVTMNQNVLLGIHVGQSFALPIENVTSRARWYGFMRIVDDEFLAALGLMLNEIEWEN